MNRMSDEAARECDGNAAPDDRLPRQQPLRGDQRGHERHPAGAHDPEREEGRHEPPAAGHAEPAVLRPHPQGAHASRAPVLAEERPRVAAATQARILRARQLVQRAAENHAFRR
jgi:hypothetical protein